MEAERPTTGDGVSLEEVRVRFLEAEDHLRRVASSIEEATTIGGELRQSRESLNQAVDGIVGLANRVGEVATGFADHDASLRRAIELLAAADPAAIREDIALLRSIAAGARESTSQEFFAIQQTLGEIQSLLAAIRREGRIAIVAASMAFLVAATVLGLTLI